jgi:hypothetical protein
MIDHQRWQGIRTENANAEADKFEEECIDPQLRSGQVYLRQDGRRVVASVNAHSIDKDVIAILHRRAIKAGWMSRVSNGWFEIQLPDPGGSE